MGDKIDTASQLVNFGALSTALHILEAVTSSVERLYFNEPTDLQVLPDKFATLLCFCQCVNQLETQAMEAVGACSLSSMLNLRLTGRSQSLRSARSLFSKCSYSSQAFLRIGHTLF